MSQFVLYNNYTNNSASNDNNNNNNHNDNSSEDSNQLPTIYRCRAPIASLDCMEEFSAPSGFADRNDDNRDLYHCNPGFPLHGVVKQPTCSPGLRYRNLGKSGLRVSNIGLGTWHIFTPNISEQQAEDLIALAVESGINVFDISEAHSGTRAEIELGKILAKRDWKRTCYIVMTKIYWSSRSEERGLSRKHIIESVKASLERLQLSYIDIVIVHKADSMCPMEEVVRAMNYVISQGWVMYWGTARWSPVEIMEAYTNCRQFNCVTPIVEQSEYHMFCREKSELYMPEIYNKIGVGLMAWSPISMMSHNKEEANIHLFSRPSFRNKYCSFSWTEDDVAKDGGKQITDDLQRQTEKMRELTMIADRLGCSLAQLSIAWCLKNESVHCLLLGAGNLTQLYDNIQSLQLIPKLNTNLMAEIEKVLDNKPLRPPMVSTLALR